MLDYRDILQEVLVSEEQLQVRIGPAFTHHHDQAGVSHDQGIGLQGDDRFHIRKIGFKLAVMGTDITGDEKFFI